MSALAASLQRALAQRTREGAARPPLACMLASGPGWQADDVVCTFGPADRPYEERHASACLAIVAAGSFGYRCGAGKAGRGRGPELMTPGALMLGEPGACFECGHRHSAGDRCISFHFDPDWLDEQAAAAGLVPRARRWSALRVPPLRALAPLVARACANVEALERGAGTPAAWDELAIALAVATLHVSAGAKDVRGQGRATLTAGSGPSAAAAARVAATLRLIEETPDSPHTLASLAAAAGVSEFYFLRTFSAVAGVTPHQYLLRSRLRVAALRLLAGEGGEKIVDIALDTGFNDLSNFNAAFRAEFGASPRAWRDAMRARELAATSWPRAASATTAPSAMATTNAAAMRLP
ncbi:HTH-type transcriptional activator RhaS [Paraburkholderia caffeinitolerans]|uniref:HTH-type transcriptional activator RhaS n=1 Tax=Paraburkholderia caffeinitolerans TaxID=1723730 RepID=A0A6J5FJD4_9BURK|nr:MULTISPECIES: AraC family transcriptional regulator [Paraburkholderia]CAB3778887.1 HTH-type transcriptional activator RhaS [Paraburkholderia caffeinitolerans]